MLASRVYKAKTYSKSLPAPTSGWVTNKNIASMKPDEALILQNYFPRADSVELIKGFEEWATGLSSAVETISQWQGPSTNKLLGAAGGNIYDITNSGAVGAALQSGLANARWQVVSMGTAGGTFTRWFNGADTPLVYDGSSFSTNPVITGPTATNLITGCLYKNRLFMAERDSLDFWYLPTSNIGGAAQKFPLGQWCFKGGYLMAMGTWTRDSGYGPDDLFVAVTSQGEVLIYQGNDPGDANAWALVGVFSIALPIGRRCMIKWANDLLLITQDGVLPMSKVITLDRQKENTVRLSENISPTWNTATNSYGNNYGWEAVLYPRQQMLIVNIPKRETLQQDQYVMNTSTQAWCNFTGVNAACWGLNGEDLYFGGNDGTVYAFDSGYNFNNEAIPGEVLTSFQYFGNMETIKQFQMVRPLLYTNGTLTFSYRCNVDFNMTRPSNAVTVNASVTPWGSPWGSPWSASQVIFEEWKSVSGVGRCGAFHMLTSTTNFKVSLRSLDWIWSSGGIL